MVVKILLVEVATFEVIRLEVDITPFTSEVITLLFDVRELVVVDTNPLIDVVAIDPPILEVKILPTKDRELLVFRLSILAFCTYTLVPVALVNSKLVIYPVAVFKRLVKKLVVVALLNVGLSVKVYVTSLLVFVATDKLEEEDKKL
jgi:hypothetical protein